MNKTPKLRFPEFSGEWEKKELGEIITLMQSGLSRKLEDKDIGIPVIRSNNLIDGKIDISNMKYWYATDNQGANLENYFLREGDLLINFINSLAQIGKGSIYNNELGRDTIFTTNIMRLNFKNEIDVRYIYNYFQLKKYNDYIQSIAKPAVNQASFTTVDFKKFKINLPNYKEQQKLATLFLLIDKKIEKQQKKVEAFQEYKKGMMQKIFSQEIRFKDENGEEYPQWKEKKLGDYAEKITKKNKDYIITNVISNSAKNGLIAQRDFFDKDIANENNIDGYYVIEPGDFVYNPRKSTESPYGPINRYSLDEAGVVSPLYLCFTINSKINGEFLAFYFKSDKWYRFVYLNSDQGARHDRVSIKDSVVFDLDMKIPSLEEQQKIADFLNKLDLKFEKEQEKLKQLNQWEKGLLQQMFV